MDNYRLLIISHNCLSRHNSNGRTLLNLLNGFQKENLIQIYTSGEFPNEDLVAEFLRVSNKDVVSSYLKLKGCYSTPQPVQTEQKGSQQQTGGKKTAVTMLLRDLVWDNAWIQHKSIYAWAQSKQPNAILLQLSDSTLLITLAVRLAKKLGIPLITYNTEDYYFKNYDYMKKTDRMGLFYRLFHLRFQKSFKKLMAYANQNVYNCYGLKRLYDEHFGCSSQVILPASDFKITEMANRENTLISYAGNLGVGRHVSLIKIANALQGIDSSLFVDVYGTADEQIQNDFAKCKGIRYHGFVSYEKVCDVIQNSRLLLHIESFDSYYKVDTRYAFSTKIVDYCASGRPIFLFAPCDCEAAEYLSNKEAAFVCSNETCLKSSLEQALNNEELREAKSKNALSLSQCMHQIDKNSQLFLKILEDLN